MSKIKTRTCPFFPVANGHYKTSGEEEYVILGNDALLKCKIPSFVSDFVSVISWQQVETGSVFYLNFDGQKRGTPPYKPTNFT